MDEIPKEIGQEIRQDVEQDMRHETFWSWTDLLLFAALGLPVFVAGLFVASAVVTPFTENKALRLMVPQFVAQSAMLLPLVYLFRWKYERSLVQALQLAVPAGRGALSIPAGIGLAICVLAAAALLKTPDTQNPMQDLMNAPGAAVWVAIFAVSVGPALEEILFRGLLQPVAVRSAGAVAGVLIGAVPFALLHGPQYGWSWRHVLLIALAGSGFGWWRHRTQSTGASTLMHAGYNGVLVVGYLLGKAAV
jgi:membrane protease YdiL (CAAX protease family)